MNVALVKYSEHSPSPCGRGLGGGVRTAAALVPYAPLPPAPSFKGRGSKPVQPLPGASQ
jgi:hypothetical protein